MKLIICFFTLLGLCTLVNAQPTCDIATNGISANPNTIAVGQTTDLVFDIFNDAQGGSCCYPVNSVQVFVSFPATGVAYHSIISPAGGNGGFFTWVYDAAENAIIGTNHTQICDGQGETSVTIRAIATTLPAYPALRQIPLSIINNPDGPPFPSNDEGNDNGVTTVQVNAPILPIDLVSFKAFSEECDQVELTWQTATEINNDFMEVQKSEDGRFFRGIGKIKGTNTSKTTSYFLNDTDVKDGTLYYYRLRQVDYDGTEKLFDPVTVRTRTCQNDKFVSVFPNPVMNKLNLLLKGFEEADVCHLIITNSIGETIRSIENISSSELKEIDVTNLVSGMYNLKIENAGRTFVQRFVKI